MIFVPKTIELSRIPGLRSENVEDGHVVGQGHLVTSTFF